MAGPGFAAASEPTRRHPATSLCAPRRAARSPELKKRLIDLCRQRGKPYGLLVRKMDFPSSASVAEVRRLLAAWRRTARQRPAR